MPTEGMGGVQLAMQAHIEAIPVLSNMILMRHLTYRQTPMYLRGAKTLQVIGMRQLMEEPRNRAASTTMDQMVPTSQACTGLRLRTDSLRMHIHHRRCRGVRSLPAREHTRRLSPNLSVPDQGHRLLLLYRASTLVYHFLCR